jgi:acetylornithine deacetylase/succinyl-diaminopimelate desuccinylase-like protein
LFGRGTSDAKGQVLAHVWALRSYLDAGHDAPPVNLKLLIDGAEEAGSPQLADLLDEHRDRIAADFVVLSDTMTWAVNVPAVCVGIRGLMKANLEISGPYSDVHAGAVSGAAPNPPAVLARMLARLHDADGRVTLPGFYDEVREPTDAERDELARLTADEAEWAARTRTRSVGGEAGRSLGERLYTRPSAEVLVLAAGDPTAPSLGVIPASATAELQFTLVPDQDPATITQQLRDWVAQQLPDGVEHQLTVAERLNQPPYATPPDHPALPILTETMSAAWGRPVARMRNAGGAPATLLATKVGAPVVFFGTGLPEDRWHGEDESVHLDTLFNGVATLALFWPRIAERLTGTVSGDRARPDQRSS